MSKILINLTFTLGFSKNQDLKLKLTGKRSNFCSRFDMECIIETNNLVQFICAYEMSSPTNKRNETKKGFWIYATIINKQNCICSSGTVASIIVYSRR